MNSIPPSGRSDYTADSFVPVLSTNDSTRKRIGVLMIDVEGAYSQMIWPEIAKQTRASGFDLVILPGGNPKYPYDFRYQFNSLYNFINARVLDALIFVPSIIGNFLSALETDRLLERICEAVPVVSLNMQLPDVPSLLIDTEVGMEKAVNHLVSVHGYNRLGILEGPRDNEEAIQRKNAFVKALKKADVPFNDKWCVHCDFTEETARKLARKNGQTWVENLDAMICANDHMALGLMDGLEDCHIDVPGDLAVVGFDDINEAPYLKTPLTTIRQPFAKLARRAAELAMDLCIGEKHNGIWEFETELVVRGTCGCDHFVCDDILSGPKIDESHNEESILSTFFIERYAPASAARYRDTIRGLIQFLRDNQPNPENTRQFLVQLESAIDTEYFTFNATPDWSFLFTFLVDFFSLFARESAGQWKLTNVFERSRYLIERKHKMREGYRNVREYENVTVPWRKTIERLSFVQTHEGLTDALDLSLPQLGVYNCYLSIFEEGSFRRGLFSAMPKYSRLILKCLNGKRDDRISPLTPVTFPSLNLWPDDHQPQAQGRVWAVGPLFNRETSYGFLICDLADMDIELLESLRHQLSITVHSCQLNNKRLKAETKLREILNELEVYNRQLKKESLFDEMTGLLNRRGFMKCARELLESDNAHGTQFALFYADMDCLKQINDSLGHAEGDRAIKDMARILSQVFRDEDVISRPGGDEFTIFTIDVPDDFPQRIQNRVLKLQDHFRQVEKRPYELQFSIGWAMGKTRMAPTDLNDLLKIADERLYEQKRARKGKFNPVPLATGK
ncbi:MAG: GGDEF domain-containing protein [Deltaproteobacteria bacterium]|nr:GGDEF domain-containing protein [Deltaproteobacteria bacterium]